MDLVVDSFMQQHALRNLTISNANFEIVRRISSDNWMRSRKQGVAETGGEEEDGNIMQDISRCGYFYQRNDIVVVFLFFYECKSCLHRIIFIICGIEHLCKQATVISSERNHSSGYTFVRKAKNTCTSHCEEKNQIATNFS